MSVRREYNDLVGKRAQLMAAAEEAMKKHNRAEYEEAMAKVAGMNSQLTDMQALIEEEDRFAKAHAVKIGTGRRDMEEMGKALRAGEAVRFNIGEMIRRNTALTAGSASVVTPAGAGTDIRDGFAATVPSLIDMVTSLPLEGLTSYEEPYVVSDMEASGGAVKTVGGTARAETDPSFKKAAIKPYEVSVTSYVDRNLSNLNAAAYAEKVQTMALRAMRRKACALIINGDGQGSPDMFGMTTAKNTEGEAIYETAALGSALTETSLDTLVFAYGGDDDLGGAAHLILDKTNLKALGEIRNANKERVYKITPDADNPNTGHVENGGLIVPYILSAAVGASKLIYGDPANYELGFFSDYVIRIDESYKAAERLHTILGDVMLGGNLVVHKGAVVGTSGV